jgi:hypothetical protein
MKRLCQDCRHEIKAASVRDNQRHFCDARCHEQWKRRMARFCSDRRQPVGFGDA